MLVLALKNRSEFRRVDYTCEANGWHCQETSVMLKVIFILDNTTGTYILRIHM